jgi:hypothetical protein
MTRNIILVIVVAIASLAVTSVAEADKGGNKWKGPPPHGNAWGYYKKFGWPDYWYGGYPYGYPPPPVHYGWPAPVYSYPPPYALPAPPVPELLPPPPPPPAP